MTRWLWILAVPILASSGTWTDFTISSMVIVSVEDSYIMRVDTNNVMTINFDKDRCVDLTENRIVFLVGNYGQGMTAPTKLCKK